MTPLVGGIVNLSPGRIMLNPLKSLAHKIVLIDTLNLVAIEEIVSPP